MAADVDVSTNVRCFNGHGILKAVQRLTLCLQMVGVGARKGQTQLFVHGGVEPHRRARQADAGSGGHQAHCIGIDFSDIVRI